MMFQKAFICAYYNAFQILGSCLILRSLPYHDETDSACTALKTLYFFASLKITCMLLFQETCLDNEETTGTVCEGYLHKEGNGHAS